jgi:hypothetical protein
MFGYEIKFLCRPGCFVDYSRVNFFFTEIKIYTGMWEYFSYFIIITSKMILIVFTAYFFLPFLRKMIDPMPLSPHLNHWHLHPQQNLPFKLFIFMSIFFIFHAYIMCILKNKKIWCYMIFRSLIVR